VFTEFEVDGNWYLVEEHVGGPTLAEILHTRRMSSPAQRLRIAAEFVGLVAGIHDAGWAWRDCKPENVIVDATGALVAIDFEGARRLTARPAAPWGTPPYLAPSPAGFGEVDDLYSVGVALSEVLTGRGFNSPAFTAVRGAAAGLRSDRPAERPSLVTVRSLLESTVREAANARADLTPVATGIILR
jgi:serine/threonine protein kinase